MSHTPQQAQKLWEMGKLSLAKKFAPELYKAWIEHSTKLSEISSNEIVLDVRNGLTLQWIEKYAKQTIAEMFTEFLGTPLRVTCRVSPTEFQSKQKTQPQKINPVGMGLLDPKNSYDNKVKKAITDSGLNEKYTFETFIIGSNNQLAHAAALAVSNSLGSAYNPLFVYGTVGVGKTHLMQAIGRKVLERDPDKRVLYCSSETFLNEMVDSIQSKKPAEFRNKYRKLDLLMIDDIQLISKWEAVQQELFHTFNVLHDAGKQIILASDRPPAEINNLAERLRSRFEGGMVADVTSPDYETRVAILKKYNEEQETKLSFESLEAIASSVEDNIRQLIGAYIKVQTYAKVTNMQVDKFIVEKILGYDREQARKKIRPEDILSLVAEEFQVSVSQLKSTTRTATVVLPRQVCMFLIRDVLNMPLESVAKILKRSDHTTVLHAISRIEELMVMDHHLRTQVTKLKNSILRAPVTKVA